MREFQTEIRTVDSLRQCHWLADAPLNETHADVRINFLEYAETKADGSIRRWS